ncbi:unnamed protein product [Symbiodinium pilosum]|uniref:Uncharacterized protein n=1 Tax=Symbiodinium pilosum TaxID=2952 RepID=A0A812QYK3_SYMPI|nr:unnamed protein product [Symbiodinium pilosum]
MMDGILPHLPSQILEEPRDDGHPMQKDATLVSTPRLWHQTTSDSDGELPDPNRVGPPRRRRPKQQQALLSKWLREKGFSEDVTEPHQQGCRFWTRKEVQYPVHVAAAEGNLELLRSMLLARADARQRTSRGRTALEIAVGCNNMFGSHDGVIAQLRSDAAIVRATDILTTLTS